MEATYVCDCCGSANGFFIDPGGGDHQQSVEDCHVCCRPNVISVQLNPVSRQYDVKAYLEDRG